MLVKGIKGMKRRNVIQAIFWMFLGITISIWSATFPFGDWNNLGPALFPLVFGLILILLGSILLSQNVTKKEVGPRETVGPVVTDRVEFIRIALILGGMLLSAALLESVGFILTMFFLILFLMKAVQPQKWRAALFYALVSSLGSFVLFKVLLKTPLPKGLLGF